MASFARTLGVALALAVPLAGCENAEYALLLRAEADGDLESMDVLVVAYDDAGGTVADRVHWVRGRPIGRSAVSIAEDPLRIAVSLRRGGHYMAHVTGYGAGRRYVATRCYAIRGVEKDRVVLVDATDADPDNDSFVENPADFCVDPTEDSGREPCTHACPASVAADCAPDDGGRFPGAPEVCADGLDEDCDGDPNDRCGDDDGDGFEACGPSSDPAACDCDDADKRVNPGESDEDECLVGFDLNCDGSVALCDRDGDGYGADRPVGGRPDCNDNPDDPAAAAVHPGAEEACTAEGSIAADENCNGLFDEIAECTPDDLDRDGADACPAGVTAGCDCNDCDPGVRPGARETCGNGVDEDCDGADTACAANDADGDGYLGTGGFNLDCLDQSADPEIDAATVYPGAPEACGDGLRQDCDLEADVACTDDGDGDGYNADQDCAPDDGARSPSATEACNNVDDDCDGTTNESVDPGEGCVIATAARSCGVGRSFCPVAFEGSDVAHCGACRARCDEAIANGCVDGACACDGAAACAGDSRCCGGSGCVDWQSNVNHCGGCGIRCDDADVNGCYAGTCDCQDPAGTNDSAFRVCDGVCADTRDTADACGTGCVDCTAMAAPQGGTRVCENSACVNKCPGALTLCGARCVNTNTDVTACGAGCDDCTDGSPLIPTNASATCNGTCGWACDPGWKRCGDACVSDATATCPAGGAPSCNVCTPPANAMFASCSGATCNYGCEDGFEDCGAGCIDVLSDPANCGGCGTACAVGETCMNGACDCDGNAASEGDGPYCTDPGEQCCPGQMPRCQNAC